MTTIEERAKAYCKREQVENIDCLHAYIIGATEQCKIDIDSICNKEVISQLAVIFFDPIISCNSKIEEAEKVLRKALENN